MTANIDLLLIQGSRTTPEYLAHLKEAVNADANPVKYLGIDPGTSNGVCGYDARCYLVFMLTIHADDMTMFMEQFEKVDTCVIEDYKLYPNKSKEQAYSNMETPRVIARVESWAERRKVKLIKQMATVKKTGYLWIGKKPLPKSNDKNHQMDAHVHFMFWAVKTGHIKAEELVRRRNL